MTATLHPTAAAQPQGMGRVRCIHLVGTGGAGMGGIAEVLHNLGYEVSGSDQRENAVTRRLQDMGVRIYIGHDAAHGLHRLSRDGAGRALAGIAAAPARAFAERAVPQLASGRAEGG